MANRSHSHGFGTEILCTGSISGSGCTRILQTQHGLFRFKTEVKPALSESTTGFWFSTEVYTGFLKARHRLFGSQGCTKVLCRTRVSRTAQSPYTLRQSDRMGEGTPSRFTLAILFACTRVDTCRRGDCMRSTSTHHLPLVRNLG
jgi:hypothetical protein